jgi:hypothetical protein
MDRTAFTVRLFVVPPRSERAYAQVDWSDGLVVVESGAIELEAINGLRRTFVKGDVLTLALTRLRVIRNRDPVPAVLSATSRKLAAKLAETAPSRRRQIAYKNACTM